MKWFHPPVLAACIVVFLTGTDLCAQAAAERTGRSPVPGSPAGKSAGAAADSAVLPLRKITVYSSGVACFEHSGTIPGPASIKLPFNVNAVNDALKSLVINDPASVAPSVHYPSEYTLLRTLKSLRIDLSGDPGIPRIIGSLKGEELELYAAGKPEGPPAAGRIIGIEYRPAFSAAESGVPPVLEPCLSLSTAQGIRIIAFKEILSFSFKDPGINADLNRALDLIMASGNSETRELTVELPGEGSRAVSISYVIPAPVWKVSYRLDLSRVSPADSRPNALLQGWAIVDNDGDGRWDNVELSLVTGRPVSFIQNLYPPYYVNRPTLPLAIAGTAEAETWDSGYGGTAAFEAEEARKVPAPQVRNSAAAADVLAEASAPGLEAAVPGPAETGMAARAAALGDQFEFTLRHPVTLEPQESAMLPLVEGTVAAVKLLILSGERALGRTVHPYLGAELRNATGMKLPAGPLTVYDGGAYAGDALIEFFNDGEKRLITWGEDLSVTAAAAESGGRFVSAVSVSGGLMTISRKQVYATTYTVRNAAGEEKQVLFEHPLTPGAELAEPEEPEEKTPSAYRFLRPLPAKGELVFTVREERPLSERITLVQQRPETLASYAANQEIPQNVRAVLQKALELKREADAAKDAQTDLEARQTRLVSEQGRIRQNLEAAGNQSPQGQDYLGRLVQMDKEIDGLTLSIDDARKNARDAQAGLEAYIASLNL
ncbi:MAG: DUF4139 domain-containing protein [Treponema sp.]|jgi:hypothetical protein|nr:DUF4139 domain-containing protein [Treponema sp.]